jgi:hypothetical protein
MFKDYKKTLVAMRGGACEICGFQGDARLLDFHHLHSKNFNLSRRPKNIGWDAVLLELSKCIMVCCMCHRKLHIGEIELPPGMQEALTEQAVELCEWLY